MWLCNHKNSFPFAQKSQNRCLGLCSSLEGQKGSRHRDGMIWEINTAWVINELINTRQVPQPWLALADVCGCQSPV